MYIVHDWCEPIQYCSVLDLPQMNWGSGYPFPDYFGCLEMGRSDDGHGQVGRKNSS